MATNGGTAAGITTESERDGGFSLLEVLIVTIILATLASISVLSVRGLADSGGNAVCTADRSTLESAVNVYLTQEGGDTIPGADAAERLSTLVDAGLISSGAPGFAIEANGDLTPTDHCA